jgi:hypothetical protein
MFPYVNSSWDFEIFWRSISALPGKGLKTFSNVKCLQGQQGRTQGRGAAGLQPPLQNHPKPKFKKYKFCKY